MNYTTPYEAPTLVVDAVIFQLIDDVLSVLLLRRAEEPFKGEWALPGGYAPKGETTHDALIRIVKRKTGVDLDRQLRYLEQLYTFDTVARDPRGHAVSVTYFGCAHHLDRFAFEEDAAFFPLNALPELAYDHRDIITYAHERLKAKFTYTNAVFAFLNDDFTMSELQNAYEAVFGHPLDKRNFRKKFLSLNLISPTGEERRSGSHRPAKLFRFNSKSLETLVRDFE